MSAGATAVLYPFIWEPSVLSACATSTRACALLPRKQLQAAVSCRRAAERLACAC
jgi:hypothetical protein